MTNIELRVKNIYDSLSNAEQIAATYFLTNVEDVFHKPIAQLAAESGVSAVTWVRFSKSIGFTGLKDLKNNLALELLSTTDTNANEPAIFSDILEPTDLSQLMTNIKNQSVRAVLDTAQLLNPADIEKAVELILNAKSIRIFGIGASALVAEDLYTKLLRIDKNVCFCRDLHVQFAYAANIAQEDVAILISMSGKTTDILELLSLVNQHGASTIALTSFNNNPLSASTNIQLYVSAPEATPRSAAMSSRIAQLIAVDVLYSAVAHHDYEHTSVKLNNSLKALSSHRQ